MLLKPKSQARYEFRRPRIHVEDVRLETLETKRLIVILFRDLDRPKCLFGYARNTLEEPDILDSFKNYFYSLKGAAEVYATIIWANWHEKIHAGRYGLPEECSPEGINWI